MSNLTKIEKLKLEYNTKNKLFIEYYNKGYRFIAGVDEVGRGPLAGPVCAAAVILDDKNKVYGLKDSKKLSEKKREELYEEVIKKSISYSFCFIEENIIDDINILNATKIAMKKAVEKLNIKPDLVFVDAVKLDIDIESISIIKGDNKTNQIAAASIIAKVERDRFMRKMDTLYPGYYFAKNKGYGTKQHINAIEQLGLTKIHRLSFTKKFQ